MRHAYLLSAALLTALSAAAALSIPGGPALAEMDGAHQILSPNDLRWKPAASAFPPGAEVAVLYGDPAATGPFVLRVRARAGYQLPPHTHPGTETVTVLSGVLRMGVGRHVDPGMERFLHAGGFSVMPKGLAHWVAVNEDVVLQIGGMGPWGITYLDPMDDPRVAKR